MRVTTWGPRSFINTRTNGATANRHRLGMFRNTRAGWAIAHSVARRPLQAYTHYNRYLRILFIIIFTAPRTKCSFFYAHPFLRRAHIYITRIQTCIVQHSVQKRRYCKKLEKKNARATTIGRPSPGLYADPLSRTYQNLQGTLDSSSPPYGRLRELCNNTAK